MRRVNPISALRISQADVVQDRREKSFFFRNSGKSQQVFLLNWVHRQPFRQSMAGISGISNFWPSIVTSRSQHPFFFFATQKSDPREIGTSEQTLFIVALEGNQTAGVHKRSRLIVCYLLGVRVRVRVSAV